MPEILKENNFYSRNRSSAVIDGRTTEDKLSFTIKWEKRFTWAYYSSYQVGFVGSAKNILIHMTNVEHGVFFSEHKNCQTHVRAVVNKSNIKKIIG